MLIILDGPPGVGKSDLAEQLCAEIIRRHPQDTVEIRRQGIPRLHPLDEYVLPLLDYRPHREAHARQPDGSMVRTPARHIICDGYHWGEYVHSTVFGRATHLNTPVFHYVEMFLASRGAHIVSLVRDAEDLADVATERGYGTPVSPEVTMMRTISGFMGVSHLSALPAEEMHVETEDIVPAIVSRARAREAAAGSVENLATYVGPPQADTLVLGNVRGPGLRHELAPAFMPYPSTCGEFLMDALTYTDVGVAPRTFGIANAWDVDDLEEIVSAVAPRRIVALGRKAWGAALQEFPRVCEVGHPVRMLEICGRSGASYWGQIIRQTLHELDRSH